MEICGAHDRALIQARPALPIVIAAPPNCAAPFQMTKPFPPAPALCPIAIALPAAMFPIQLWAVAAADPVSRKHIVSQTSYCSKKVTIISLAFLAYCTYLLVYRSS